jgi:hypothetical protein
MSRLARDSGSAPIQVLRHSTNQAISISGTAASSNAVNTRVVRLVSTVDVHFSLTGTATTSSPLLPANAIEFVHTYDGDTISFITSGGSGTVHVTEMI